MLQERIRNMKQTEEKELQEAELPKVSFDEFVAPDYEEWKQEAIATLKGGSFEKKLFTKTYEGITLEPMYTMEMAPNPEELSNLPGMENYMRGTHEGGYITKPWLIAQQMDDVIPAELNKLIKHELEKGATAINIKLDALTKQGQNGDKIDKQIQKGGVSISTIQDMYEVFAGLDLRKYQLYVNCGANNSLMISMLSAMLKANSQKLTDVHGCIGADPIGVLVAKGELSASLDDLFDELAKTVKWTEKNVPELRTIILDGQVYSDGGASAVQELGYVLATAITYIRELQKRGLEINTIAKQMQFTFSLGAMFFMEIAKLRAARQLWSKVVESFGGDKEAQKMIIHACTANFNKTVYEPYVNMLRTTTEAFSAVVGGIDSLEVQPFDSAIRLGDEFSRRIARNTQIMLQNECNLCQPVDPAGGSWYIESLTKQVAEKSWQVMQQVEVDGGMIEALKAGKVQDDVKDVLMQRFKKLAQRADRVVGVNMYANALEELLEKNELDVAVIKEMRTKQINDFVDDIDEKFRDEKLLQLRQSIQNKSDDLINVLEAVFSAGATLEDARNVLYETSEGENIPCMVEKHRFTEQFEQLRDKAKAYEVEHGEKLKIFLANMGKIPQHKPRADFSTGFFEVGGFEVLKNDGFMTTDEAAEAAVKSGALVAIICSTDDTYPELVPPVAKKIKAEKPEMIVMLAGAPAPEYEASYREAGVEEFIHVRANCYNILTWLQQQGGIK